MGCGLQNPEETGGPQATRFLVSGGSGHSGAYILRITVAQKPELGFGRFARGARMPVPAGDPLDGCARDAGSDGCVVGYACQ